MYVCMCVSVTYECIKSYQITGANRNTGADHLDNMFSQIINRHLRNTLQHTTTHYITLQNTAAQCSALQHTAMPRIYL